MANVTIQSRIMELKELTRKLKIDMVQYSGYTPESDKGEGKTIPSINSKVVIDEINVTLSDIFENLGICIDAFRNIKERLGMPYEPANSK